MPVQNTKPFLRIIKWLFALGIACSSVHALALDLSKYLAIKPGNQSSWVSGGVTKTSTIGSPVVLPTGVSAVTDSMVQSDEIGTLVSYVTIDQNGYRLHQGYKSNVVIAGKTTTSTMELTPPLVVAPLNVEVGKSYTSTSTVLVTFANVGSYTLNYTSNINIVGFEAVSNQSGTQSWSALKVIHSSTMSGTVNGQFISDTTSSTSWLVEGLGDVQYKNTNAAGVIETWKLSYTNVVIPTTTTSTSTSTTAQTTTTTIAATTTTTLPAEATASSTANSMVLMVEQGWSLLGNTLDQMFPVASLFADSATITTVWKWDAANAAWQFYTPTLEPVALEAYAKSKGYAVLTNIQPGDGFWVNAKARTYRGTITGQPYSIGASKLSAGWNLMATANKITPTALNLLITDPFAQPPAAGTVTSSLTTLWAWDTALTKWYFYAPSLESSDSVSTCGCGVAKGGTKLLDYTNSKGYLDFRSTGKTLGPGVGFWLNK